MLTNQLVAGESSVRFSKQALCRALYGRPGGGGELRAVSKALDRLTSTRLTFGGYVAERRATVKPIAFWDVRLLEELTMVNVPSRASYEAHFQPWLLSQLELGHATFVDGKHSARYTGWQSGCFSMPQDRALRTRGHVGTVTRSSFLGLAASQP